VEHEAVLVVQQLEANNNFDIPTHHPAVGLSCRGGSRFSMRQTRTALLMKQRAGLSFCVACLLEVLSFTSSSVLRINS
jgi:hypothetical protein